MLLFRGPYVQRGRGIGSVLSSLWSTVAPALSSLGRSIFGSPIGQDVKKAIAQSAIKTGMNVAADVISGDKPAKESFQKELGQARKRVAQAIRKHVPKNENRSVSPPRRHVNVRNRLPVKRRKISVFEQRGRGRKKDDRQNYSSPDEDSDSD